MVEVGSSKINYLAFSGDVGLLSWTHSGHQAELSWWWALVSVPCSAWQLTRKRRCGPKIQHPLTAWGSLSKLWHPGSFTNAWGVQMGSGRETTMYRAHEGLVHKLGRLIRVFIATTCMVTEWMKLHKIMAGVWWIESSLACHRTVQKALWMSRSLTW